MLSHDSGTSLLAEGGSIVTRLSEDKQDWSAVIEKMSTANSVCARGSNPVSAMTVEGNTQMRATWRAVFLQESFLAFVPSLSWYLIACPHRERKHNSQNAPVGVFGLFCRPSAASHGRIRGAHPHIERLSSQRCQD
jgi:hypothetical protein